MALLANTIAEAFAAYAKTLQDDRYRSFISSREARIGAQRRLVEQAQSKIDAVDAKGGGRSRARPPPGTPR